MQGKNHLASETSPYLLAHADNPIDWYPWKEEAFQKAVKEDKPIFLSIGYATCHWCHVMERESFEDEEVAQVLNRSFVSIKVDREERPDVDEVYMEVCQRMTGRGGWPLTVLITPEKKPFFAATYLPKENLLNLLYQVEELWKRDREKIRNSAEDVANLLKEASPRASSTLKAEDISSLFSFFHRSFDPVHKGFGNAPKFPTPGVLFFLSSVGGESEQKLVEETLKALLLRGIWDHVGGGLHRYSVTRDWSVPHYEKMLYDQAFLLLALSAAYHQKPDSLFRERAEELVAFVERELASPEGACYTALDADSEGVEGKFYLWKEEEVRTLLSPADTKWFIARFHVPKEEERPLYLDSPLTKEERKRFKEIRKALFRAREKRVPPLRDDKILLDQNAWMVWALVEASLAFDKPAWKERAEKVWLFIKKHMMTEEGKLYHAYAKGKPTLPGFSSDYASLSFALLELYRVTQNLAYLKESRDIFQTMDRLFLAKDGLYALASPDHGTLFHTPKPFYEGAYPSANTMALIASTWLYHLTGDKQYRTRAERLLQHLATPAQRYPLGFPLGLWANHSFSQGMETLVVVLPQGETFKEKRKYLARPPFDALLLLKTDENAKALGELAPFTASLSLIEGKTTFYRCKNFTCDLPTHQWHE